MIKKTVLILLSSFILSSSALAKSEQSDLDATNEQECRRWAKEDGVPKKELQDYVYQCIETLRETKDSTMANSLEESEDIPEWQNNEIITEESYYPDEDSLDDVNVPNPTYKNTVPLKKTGSNNN
ncbi:MAG: hypothetical protein HQL69_11345 [Magnetococcales bacterium]|nr:hypothetical protein [Magnetococcales bacterium]